MAMPAARARLNNSGKWWSRLKMLPIRTAIHIPGVVYMAVMHESVPANPDLFRPLKEGRVNHVERFFDELLWSARALKQARLA